MPSPPAFLKGFSIHKGMNFNSFTLQKIKIEHVEVVKWRKYAYPITLVFEGDTTSATHKKEFKEKLSSHLSGERIINSRYGNPYKCFFGSLHFEWGDGKVTVESVGSGVRIFSWE